MNATEISDKQLISEYLSGKQISLERLIHRHQNKVFAYILMIVKDKQLADDIFQDTFIKVIKTIRGGTYKEEGKFIQWVMRIANNLIIDHFRKSKRIPVVDNNHDEFDIFETIKFTDPSIEEMMVTTQIHRTFAHWLNYFPKSRKRCL